MANLDNKTLVTAAVVTIVVVAGLYLLDPTLFGLLRSSKEGFEATESANANYTAVAGQNDVPGEQRKKENTVMVDTNMGGDATSSQQVPASEGFADLASMEGPAAFGDAQAPAGCYPRDQLTPVELLPKDPNSVWAQQNPLGSGSLKGKNFLSAGALIGINTVGQSLRNANYQIRSEPPNPQIPVSVFYQSTITPDINRRTLEIA